MMNNDINNRKITIHIIKSTFHIRINIENEIITFKIVLLFHKKMNSIILCIMAYIPMHQYKL